MCVHVRDGSPAPTATTFCPPSAHALVVVQKPPQKVAIHTLLPLPSPALILPPCVAKVQPAPTPCPSIAAAATPCPNGGGIAAATTTAAVAASVVQGKVVLLLLLLLMVVGEVEGAPSTPREPPHPHPSPSPYSHTQ